MIKINKKYSRLLFGICMSLMMAFTMSFVMVLINVGFVDNFFSIWLRGLSVGFIVAFPTSFLAVPLSKKIIKKLTNSEVED